MKNSIGCDESWCVDFKECPYASDDECPRINGGAARKSEKVDRDLYR